MAIQTHSSKEQVVSSGARYTGVANMIVVAINPTMDELKQLGSTPQKEPQYITEELGDALGAREGGTFKKHRLEIHLASPQYKFRSKVTFFLEDRIRYNKDGNKVGWINKFGVTSWSPDETQFPSYDYFKSDMARPYYVGEDLLTNFIKAWANCGPTDQAILDNPKALMQGDLSELKALHKAISSNEVQCLNGVNKVTSDSGKVAYYQTIYSLYFDRPYNKDMSRWRNALEAPYGAFRNADYQNSLEFKTFEGGKEIEADKPTDMNSMDFSSNAGMPNMPNANGTGKTFDF